MFWRFWASYWCSAPKIFVDFEHKLHSGAAHRNKGYGVCGYCGALHLATPYSRGLQRLLVRCTSTKKFGMTHVACLAPEL